MGIDLSWYIVPKHIEHDTSKTMCLNLEWEPESDEIDELIYAKLHPESDDYSKYKETEKLKKELSFEWRYNSEKTVDWCPKCKMFMTGLYDSPLVIDDMHIHHSYSNPILRSDCNVKRLWLGDSSTDFVRKFDHNKMYREISASEIECAYDRVERLGNCFRTSDKEAKEETLAVLDFLKKYKNNPDVIMIMDDEF